MPVDPIRHDVAEGAVAVNVVPDSAQSEDGGGSRSQDAIAIIATPDVAAPLLVPAVANPVLRA